MVFTGAWSALPSGALPPAPNLLNKQQEFNFRFCSLSCLLQERCCAVIFFPLSVYRILFSPNSASPSELMHQFSEIVASRNLRLSLQLICFSGPLQLFPSLIAAIILFHISRKLASRPLL